MKTLTLLFVLHTFSLISLAQSQFQDFLDRVNSLSDPAEKEAVIDSFMTVARAQGIPFIEESTANFLYLGNVTSVEVPGDFNGWTPANAMLQNLSQTNFWYYSQDFELNARLDYKFVLNGTNWILDPENPNTVLGGFGPNSELAMPEYVQPWEINFNPNIQHGTIQSKSIYSNHLNATHQLKIYLPPGYNDAQNYPSVYFQDGFEYVDLGSAINVIDNLIDSNKIDPIIAVFVKPNNRNEEYAFSKRNQYRLFFVEELVPFIDSVYNTISDPKQRLVLGDSYGGNISALISYNHADVFGLCGLHSGAFQPNNYEAYNLIVNGEKKDIKWSSVWGSYEPLDQNMRNFRDSLLTKGYEFDWIELPEGHSWGLWRATIDFMLEYFFPASSTGIDETGSILPKEFLLEQNYPNPFNPSTKIKFTIPQSVILSGAKNLATLKVYDVLGNEVATLVNEEKPVGEYEVEFDVNGHSSKSGNLASGIYFYVLASNEFRESKKMVYLK